MLGARAMLFGAVCCLAIVGTACRSASERPAAQSPSVPPRTEPALSVVQTGLRDPAATPWQRARVVDPRTLDLYYTGSAAGCLALANVRVAETATTITATVFLGVPPTAGGDDCTLGGVEARTRVPLREPLGERTVIDGGATPPAARTVERG